MLQWKDDPDSRCPPIQKECHVNGRIGNLLLRRTFHIAVSVQQQETETRTEWSNTIERIRQSEHPSLALHRNEMPIAIEQLLGRQQALRPVAVR